ncbi:MAG: hypothetical protein WBF42_19305 [Terracidiphilus sp.]
MGANDSIPGWRGKSFEFPTSICFAASLSHGNFPNMSVRVLMIVSVSLLLGVAASIAQTPQPPAAAPTALITFYSIGRLWTTGKHGKFVGQILDGNEKLALLTPGRFVTFELPTGKHVLAANSWLNPTPAGGGHLELDIVPGHRYYVAAYLDDRGVFVPLFRLEQHPCEQALNETAKVKPLGQGHLHQYGRSHVVVESSFPTCSALPQQTGISAN